MDAPSTTSNPLAAMLKPAGGGDSPLSTSPAAPDLPAAPSPEEAAAGSDVMSAMQAGNAPKFTRALKAFIELCGYSKE